MIRGLKRKLYSNLFSGTSLTFVDIGARGFGCHYFRGFHGLLDLLAFEPDQAEYERMSQSDEKQKWRKFALSRLGVSGGGGTRDLHLTPHRGCTSILMPKAEFARRYDRDDFFTVERTVQIETTTLEKALVEAKVENAIFLKIDIEGAEQEVLASLDSSYDRICAIETEVNYLPYRENQGTAGAIHEMLRERGFDLIQIRSVGDYRYCGIGTSYPGRNSRNSDFPEYSRGDVCAADFIFLKSPERVPERFLEAYAGICIELEQFDKAAIALRRAKRSDLLADLRTYSSRLFRIRRSIDWAKESLNPVAPLLWLRMKLRALLGV